MMSAVVVVRSLKSKKKSFLLLLLLVSLERERESLLKAVRFAPVVRLSTTTTKKKLRGASFLRLKCEEELDIRWIYFTVVFCCVFFRRERERERERACP